MIDQDEADKLFDDFCDAVNGKIKFGFPFAEENNLHGGIQYVFRFSNGRGASVVRHRFSYGREKGLWELAVTNHTGELDYSTPITDDVLGWLNETEVENILGKISNLDEIE